MNYDEESDWDAAKYDSDEDNDSENSEAEDDDGETCNCPFCKEEIYDDSERCPHCEKWISGAELLGNTQPPWVVITAALLLLLILFLSVFTVLG